MTSMLVEWRPNIYVVASLLAFLTAVCFATFVWQKARHNSSSAPFIVMCLAGGIWCLFPFLASLPFHDEKSLMIARLPYIAASIGVIAFINLAFSITKDSRIQYRRWVMGCCYVVSSFFILFNQSDLFIIGLIKWQPFFAPVGGVLFHAFVGFYAIGFVLVLETFIRNLRNASKEHKNRIIYFFIAYVILLFSPLMHFSAFYFRFEPFPHDFLVPLFVLICTYAILKHQLMDIRIVIRKGLVYSLLVGLMTAGFMAVVLVMERWFQGFMGYQSIVASAVVAFAVAIFFNPLRERIQSWVDKALFKGTAAELSEQREQLLGEVQKSEHMRSVGTLAAGLAHEIKNPLTAIKTFTEYLDEQGSDPDFQRNFKRIVGGEVERINAIVNQLLDFSKPKPLQQDRAELASVVEEVAELLNNELMSRKIRLHLDFSGRGYCWIDKRQMKQVVLNLMLNAMDAMPEGGALRIRISRESARSRGHIKASDSECYVSPEANGRGHDDRSEAHESCPRIKSRDLVILTIADTGHGMSKEQLKKIFTPFYSSKTKGTGLGLSIVQRIVEAHEGRMNVISKPGQGAKVSIMLRSLETDETAESTTEFRTDQVAA